MAYFQWPLSNNPPSPPALGNLLSAPTGSSDHFEPTPATASAFYLFLNGEVNPRLLDTQPSSFLGSKENTNGPFYLCPHNGLGCVIYPSK
ncbi:hypothetical protein O181_076703 [Austropuccinia psidii MF-1]|uniref:Uncharacterized protein n=1 Tax=Austropuccinia psidii MF-1 TaxID=1389203 RepID=A0A9Q3FBC9_9BASI|nr:hypothetical protein [Austropuccinia psidii MF-1]